MSIQTLLRMVCLLVCLFVTTEGAAQVVNIPDTNLRAAVENALGKASGATITVADMETFTAGLTARDANISNLTGLEHATNLRWLDFINNNISDLSPISGLTNLTTLNLDNNNISDLSPLVSNTALGTGVTVDVEGNPLNTASINTHIPTLQGRGVRVFFHAPQTVNIPDANLRAAIETALGKVAGAPITADEMATLGRLIAQNANIRDLTGLEQATNLTTLMLEHNSASNLSPLAGLTNLRTLYLDGNSISDITPLSELTNLSQLDLEVNSILNVSALGSLSNLGWLNLKNNSVSDLSPLVSNTGLGSGDTVDVRGNPLSTQSLQTHIPALQGRGITVLFDAPQTVNIPDANLRAAIENALGKASGATITVADMETFTAGLTARDANISNLTGLEHATNLRWLDFINNNISDLSPISGLTNLTTLNLDNNNISDLSPLVSNTALGTGVTVDVEGNPLNTASINTHIPTLQGRGVRVFFHAPQTVNIPDANLRAAIETALGKASGAPITVADMETLTAGLTARDANISNLTGLEHATNLRWLDFINNNISDLSPISGLTNLTTLNLDNNNISDLSPLVSNTALGTGVTVDVEGNPLSTASINTHIPTLQGRGVRVFFHAPQTVNIPDANLRAAIEEYLGKASGAPITVADMETLTAGLAARDANISNLTGLEHATNLRWLDFINNNISDLSPISGLTNLTTLNLDNNNISDLSPLVSNTALGTGVTVDVEGNPLSTASLNTHIPTLQGRGVTVYFDAPSWKR